jgi:hypothetical protein
MILTSVPNSVNGNLELPNFLSLPSKIAAYALQFLLSMKPYGENEKEIMELTGAAEAFFDSPFFFLTGIDCFWQLLTQHNYYGRRDENDKAGKTNERKKSMSEPARYNKQIEVIYFFFAIETDRVNL